MARQILVATDFSPRGREAEDRAVALARATGSHLHLLHVLPLGTPDLAGALAGDGQVVFQFEEVLRKHAQAAMDAEVRRLSEAGVAVTVHILSGHAVAEIVAAAQRLHADVVVVGSAGRSGIARLLLGSVAEGVARQAPMSVLIVRPSVEAAP